MAALPTIDASEDLGAEVVGQVLLIRTDMILRGERLRPIDPLWAHALGQVMLREGQRTPVEVCRLPGKDQWTLVAGGHRHAGAEDADIAYMRAEVVSADRDDRRMREVSENLWRRDLNPIDRAAFVAEAVAIHKRRAGIDPKADGRAVSAATRWQKAVKEEAADANVTMTIAYGWADEVAQDLGFSRSKIERDLMLYRRLAPSAIAQLRDARHPVLLNAAQLRALAKLEQAEQVEAAEALLSGRAKTVAAAIAMLRGGSSAGKSATNPDSKRLSAFIGAFSRMGTAERKGALAELQHLLPAGFTITEGKPEPTRHEHEREALMAAIDDTREVIDGILEDEIIVDFERADALRQAGGKLQLSRMALAIDVVPLAGDA